MAAKFTTSNSTVKKQIEALKEEKRLIREIEAQIALQAEADAARKKVLSDHRIATKLAKINGTEPPPPLEPAPVMAPEPKVEPEPVAEQKTVAQPAARKPPSSKAKAKKAPAKKAPLKKKED